MASLVNVKSPDKSGVYVPVVNNVRQEQVHWHTLGGHLADTNPDFQDWLLRGGVSLQDAAAPAKLAGLISKQASMQAFSDLYAAIAVSFLFLLPLVAMLRKPPRP
jgi:hypothetical protein